MKKPATVGGLVKLIAKRAEGPKNLVLAGAPVDAQSAPPGGGPKTKLV
jgi:hypothetical protein